MQAQYAAAEAMPLPLLSDDSEHYPPTSHTTLRDPEGADPIQSRRGWLGRESSVFSRGLTVHGGVDGPVNGRTVLSIRAHVNKLCAGLLRIQILLIAKSSQSQQRRCSGEQH